MASIPDHLLDQVRVPVNSSKIYKDECVYSFQTPELEGGLYVSMNDFLGLSLKYVDLHSLKTKQGIYLHIVKVAKPKPVEEQQPATVGDDEPPRKKPAILGIGVEGGFDAQVGPEEFEEKYQIYLHPTKQYIPYPNPSLPEKVQKSADGIIKGQSSSKKEEVATWSAEQVVPSKYADNLKQLDNPAKVPPAGWKCNVEGCDKTENLWLNLTDGFIACGRKNYDGTGGNGHAQAHYDGTGFPLSVKLGTIQGEQADVYSYPEDNMVSDPHLTKHLLHFGIDVAAMTKTEKSIAELELDQNIAFEFSRISEKGKDLRPLYGPGLTGIENLGNSCYMSSVLQVLFSIPDFQTRYFANKDNIFASSHSPATDFEVQMAKLAHGLLSGEYSIPTEKEKEAKEEQAKDFVLPTQKGIAPRIFKSLVGANHPEFSTNRQQDALEFLQHLITLVERDERNKLGGSADPTKALSFAVEEKIVDPQSGCVDYTYRSDNSLSLPVPVERATNLSEAGKEGYRPRVALEECIKSLAETESVAGFYSSASKSRVTANKSTKLATFPDILTLSIRRFVIGDGWVPKKLDVSIDAPKELDISFLRGNGRQSGEAEFPKEENAPPAAAAAGPAAEEEIVRALADMGFPRVRCVKAAIATSNQGAEQAMNWLMDHMDDADIDVEPPAPSASASGGPKKGEPKAEDVEMLMAMGFTPSQAAKALRKTDNNVERAADWAFSHPDELDTPDEAPAAAASSSAARDPKQGQRDGSGKYRLLGFISHIGTSTTGGHYVCHLLKDGVWVNFNDRKVAQSEEPPFDMGYIYFYQRI